jgi:hypothetical protein
VAVGVLLFLGGGAAAADGPPYHDERVTAALGLCDSAGNQIREGSLVAHPFVTLAIATQPGPAEYAGEGRTATLFAYQPRKGTEPGEWSGEQLTSSTKYADATHPTSKAEAADESLADYLDTYPARWDGWVQLRMLLSAPGTPALTDSYAAADIHVDTAHGRWEQVGAPDVACAPAAAQAVSLEEQVGLTHVSTTTPGEATPASEAAPAATRARHAKSTAGGGFNLAIAALAGGAVALGVGVAVARRRQSPLN